MTEKSLQVVVDNVEVGEWGLTFNGQLTPENWFDAVLKIQELDGKLQWYLGDLAAYAESPVTGWGESKYKELIDGTGYTWDTLKDFAVVSRRFPIKFRENVELHNSTFNVSFNHFRAVTGLDDNFAFYWLKKAAQNAWGVAKLRYEIAKWKVTKELPAEAGEEGEKPLTVAQQMKVAWTHARDLALSEGAEMVRIQVVKNGKVLDEYFVEFEVE